MVKLVWFGMPTCPHCQNLKKHLKENNIENTLYCSKEKEGQEMADKWGITSYPTMFVLKDNIIVDVKVGFNEEESIRDYLSKF